jgi:hypothetical protein
MVEMSELLQPPETPAEAITLARALEAPGALEYLERHFGEAGVTTAYDNVRTWYQHCLYPETLPEGQQGEPLLAGSVAEMPLDSTLPGDIEELASDAAFWKPETPPVPFTATQSEVVLTALRRVVLSGHWLPESYEVLRTADYLAGRSPSELERRRMAQLVQAAIGEAA